MRIFSSLLIILLGTSAYASPMRWDLDNVSFDDGTTATGYLVVDPVTEEILEVFVKTENGTFPGVRSGAQYLQASSYIYDTAGTGPLGIPSLSVTLEREFRSGNTYESEFSFTLANPAPLETAGTASIGLDLTGVDAIESTCGYDAYYGTECLENFTGERNASGTLSGYPYVPTVHYVEDNRSAFWLGGNSEGNWNYSYEPDAPFADFSERGLTSYLRSGNIYVSGSSSAASVGGSNGRLAGTFDVIFYLTAPTEIAMTGRVSASNEEYGSAWANVGLYSGAEINPDNQLFFIEADTYEDYYGESFNYNFT